MGGFCGAVTELVWGSTGAARRRGNGDGGSGVNLSSLRLMGEGGGRGGFGLGIDARSRFEVVLVVWLMRAAGCGKETGREVVLVIRSMRATFRGTGILVLKSM
jgi:hypothetical protein